MQVIARSPFRLALLGVTLLAAAPLGAAPGGAAAPAEIETVFRAVDRGTQAEVARSPGQTRAVILIHGYRAHPFSIAGARAAEFHDWQKPGATMVEELSSVADVYSFAYGQNVSVSAVADSPALAAAVASLTEAKYREITLVGHSAGGLISREFVERHPDAGVTKVIQVCSPNGGSHLAKASVIALHKEQAAFAQSLVSRLVPAAEGDAPKVPDHVDFVSVIGDGFGAGDLAVFDERQWPADLQAQGTRAVQIRTMHFTAMRSRRVARVLLELVRDPQPRWTPEQAKQARLDFLESPIERAIANANEMAADHGEPPDPPPPAP